MNTFKKLLLIGTLSLTAACAKDNGPSATQSAPAANVILTNWEKFDLTNYSLNSEYKGMIDIIAPNHKALPSVISIMKELSSEDKENLITIYNVDSNPIEICVANKVNIAFDETSKDMKHYTMTVGGSYAGDNQVTRDAFCKEEKVFHLYFVEPSEGHPRDRLFICSAIKEEMEEAMKPFGETNFLNFCNALERE